MTWQAILPFRPTPVNDLLRMHWAKRNRILKMEYAAIAILCRDIPGATGKRRVRQLITLAGQDKKQDNDGAWKGLLDGLVKCGRLVDDSTDWVETLPIEFERGTQRKITIFIEDIAMEKAS